MPPVRALWLIVDGNVPTAFRARRREDLLPTLNQLKRTQPNVALVWLERGRTWESPAAAREAFEVRRRIARERKPDWRPGGSHKDPRAKYQLTRDQKRARFKKRAAFGRSEVEGSGPKSPPKPRGPWKPRAPWKPRGPSGPKRPGGPKGRR